MKRGTPRNQKLYHEISTKLMTGVGGIQCPCCNRYGTARNAKPFVHRVLRRGLKMRLRNEIIAMMEEREADFMDAIRELRDFGFFDDFFMEEYYADRT